MIAAASPFAATTPTTPAKATITATIAASWPETNISRLRTTSASSNGPITIATAIANCLPNGPARPRARAATATRAAAKAAQPIPARISSTTSVPPPNDETPIAAAAERGEQDRQRRSAAHGWNR